MKYTPQGEDTLAPAFITECRRHQERQAERLQRLVPASPRLTIYQITSRPSQGFPRPAPASSPIQFRKKNLVTRAACLSSGVHYTLSPGFPILSANSNASRRKIRALQLEPDRGRRAIPQPPSTLNQKIKHLPIEIPQAQQRIAIPGRTGFIFVKGVFRGFWRGQGLQNRNNGDPVTTSFAESAARLPARPPGICLPADRAALVLQFRARTEPESDKRGCAGCSQESEGSPIRTTISTWLRT